MTQQEALVSLNMVADIGTIRLNKLLKFFDKPENILGASYERLTQVSGIGQSIAAKINSFKEKDLELEFDLARKLGLKILTKDDEEYPKNLKDTIDPPLVLYVKGELRPEDKNAIGIVGSRRASFYGLDNAQKFAFGLSEEGFTIVSGMARGIDTYAHRGALKAKGRTIAVMGSGFNKIYPEENKDLAEEISRNGAVISEFPVNAKPLKQNFPRRNRLISGLSLGVLVAEAARNSGALITADFALEQGREVFAIPGKVDSDNSFGTNELIKQGAKLVSCLEDILEEFNLPKIIVSKIKEKKGEPLSLGLSDNVQEKEVYQFISGESIQIDELAEKTNLDIQQLSSILLKLQFKKLIRQLPGKQFVRSQDEK